MPQVHPRPSDLIRTLNLPPYKLRLPSTYGPLAVCSAKHRFGLITAGKEFLNTGASEAWRSRIEEVMRVKKPFTLMEVSSTLSTTYIKICWGNTVPMIISRGQCCMTLSSICCSTMPGPALGSSSKSQSDLLKLRKGNSVFLWLGMSGTLTASLSVSTRPRTGLEVPPKPHIITAHERKQICHWVSLPRLMTITRRRLRLRDRNHLLIGITTIQKARVVNLAATVS